MNGQRPLPRRLREDAGDAIERLAKELLEQEATGDRARAEAWFSKYDKMPAELKAALDGGEGRAGGRRSDLLVPETVD